MDFGEQLKYVETHWPMLAALITGVTGGIAAIIGNFKMKTLRREKDILRLQRIEQAIGKSVLDGEETLVTTASLERCKRTIVRAIEVKAEEGAERDKGFNLRLDAILLKIA